MRVLPAAILAALVAFAVLTAPAAAGPAKPGSVKELRQPDGTSFTGHLYGDEWENGYETRGGHTVVRDRGSGFWEYAGKGQDGRLVASGRRPGRDAPSGAPHLRDDTREPLPDPAPARSGTIPGVADPVNIGTQRSLVILVRFTDQPSLGTTVANWSSRYFGTSDSVRSYYKEVSFGKLDIAPAAESCGTANDGVAGWFNLNRTHPNLHQLDQTTISEAQEVVRDAIVAANGCVNYASFDADRNGALESDELHITVIPAGWEASSNCAQPSVWAHKYGAYGYTPTVDGVRAGVTYTMFGEKHCDGGTTNARMAQLGVMVHEIGHDLGWPDLYDVDYSSKGNVGYWSLMASGSWLSLPAEWPGASPPHPDAFSKAYQGWITPTQVTGTVNAVSLPQAGTNPVARQLRANPGGIDWSMNVTSGTGEYFLVENRQPVGYDRAIPGCGIAIWHIDEATHRDTPNAFEPRRLVALEEADGNADYPLDATDVWRGAKTFNSTSTPNSRLYDGSLSGVAASNFSSTCGATMTANLTGSGATPAVGGDAFASAFAVGSTPYARTGVDTTNASVQSGEPSSCAPPGSTSVNFGKTVWFKYVPGANGTATAETTGSAFDTVLAAREGTSFGTFVQRACNDDADGTRQSKASFPVTAGRTYYLQIGGYSDANGTAGGALSFKLAGPAPGTGTLAAPANDAFGSAVVASTLPLTRTGLNTAAATTQTGERTACTPPGGTAQNYGRTVWYRYTPNVDMAVDASTAGSSFNTVMAIHRGTTLGGLTTVGCNNNVSASNLTSRLQLNLVGGQTYYIQVGGYRSTSTGTPASGSLNLAVTGKPRADAFAFASPITSLPFTRSGIDTSKLTTQTGENLNPCASLGRTMWFTITPTGSGTRVIDTAGSTGTAGGVLDTVVAVYSGTSLGGLTKVACNDDDGTVMTSRVSFSAVAGRKYYIQVGGYKGTDGQVPSGRLKLNMAIG